MNHSGSAETAGEITESSMASAMERATKKHSGSTAGGQTAGAARGWLAALVVFAVVAVVFSLA